MSIFDHFCPHCGSILEKQEGFSPRKKGWICKECGQALYGKDDKKRKYQGIVWICDSCGEILDNQEGFNDKKGKWKCKSCGFDNIIDESNIVSDEEKSSPKKNKRKKKTTKNNVEKNNFFEEETNNDYTNSMNQSYDFENNDHEYDDSFDGEEEDDDYDDESYEYNDEIDDDSTSYEEYEKIYEEKRKKKEMLEKIRVEEEKIDKEKRKAWTRKNRKGILISIVLFLILLLILFVYILHENIIQVGYNSNELIGLKYDLVEEKLYSKGFTDIEIRKISDLTLEEKNKSEIVTEVLIGNNNDFNSKSRFFLNEKIIIVYHTTMKISPPITSKDAKGKQWKDMRR